MKNTITSIPQIVPTIEVQVHRNPKDPAGQIISATKALTVSTIGSIDTIFTGRGLKKVIINPIMVRKAIKPNIPPTI